MALPGDFLFLDESGDLGMKDTSTPFFAIGILHVKSRDAFKRAIKRARRKSLGRNAPLNELKWSDSQASVRIAVMSEIVEETHLIEGVSACVMDKRWINPTLAQRQELIRYNYAVRIALEKGGLFESASKGRQIDLTIDARNRRATETLRSYIELLSASKELTCNVSVNPNDSKNCPQLQVTDFVVGAIYSAYANRNWFYMNLLRKAGIPFSLRALRRREPAP